MEYRDNWGGKTGSGGIADASAVQRVRKQRLRELTGIGIGIDKNNSNNNNNNSKGAKDPWVLRNHRGEIECKLCLTIHKNEANYLAHTQARRHKDNLALHAARSGSANEAHAGQARSHHHDPIASVAKRPKSIKIGRPAYKITKQRDPQLRQNSLLVQVLYPFIAQNVQPRFRIMSAFEQRKEPPDTKYQYLVLAADPYETIAFKIPSSEIDRTPNRFYSNWDRDKKAFTLQLFFKPRADIVPPPSELHHRDQDR